MNLYFEIYRLTDIFVSISFHKDEKHLLTIQNPEKTGTSYLTKWDLTKDCEPVKTIRLHNAPVTAAALE